MGSSRWSEPTSLVGGITLNCVDCDYDQMWCLFCAAIFVPTLEPSSCHKLTAGIDHGAVLSTQSSELCTERDAGHHTPLSAEMAAGLAAESGVITLEPGRP